MNPRIGVILAGGQSTRMQAIDKAEIMIGAKRLIDLVFDNLKTQCGEILISASHDYNLERPIIRDDPFLPGGPVGGVLSVAKTLNARYKFYEGFFTVPVDGPNLPPDFCKRIYDKSASSIAKDQNGTHPSFAWWRLEDLNRSLSAHETLESLSLHGLAHQCGAQPVTWLEPNLFLNINTPNDLSNYLTDSISADND